MPHFKRIHTKYHKLEGARLVLDMGGTAATNQQCKAWLDLKYFNEMLAMCANLPRYIIHRDLITMLSDKDGAMQKSLGTMIEHDLAHLPFEQVLVEFEETAEITNVDRGMRKMTARHFIWLQERKDDPNPFVAVPWVYLEEDNVICVSPLAASCRMVTQEQAKKISEETGLEVSGAGNGAVYTAVIGPQIKEGVFGKKRSEIIDKALSHSLTPVTNALCALVVLLRTRGIEKEVIQVDPKLNRKRTSTGKPRINDHTVIHIGHTYNRAGERVEYKGGQSYTYPVYWVPGHVRGVRYGPKKSRIYDLFIEPYLVNYTGEGEIPKPKIKEVVV